MIEDSTPHYGDIFYATDICSTTCATNNKAIIDY
jgi:hypothetical protein